MTSSDRWTVAEVFVVGEPEDYDGPPRQTVRIVGTEVYGIEADFEFGPRIEPPGAAAAPPAELPRGYEAAVHPIDGSIRIIDHYGSPVEKALRFPNADALAAVGRALVAWAEQQLGQPSSSR